tara:strand:+ start:813 stop:1652 length:840 start_codon:yes stop_codon:yes gene_type:complete
MAVKYVGSKKNLLTQIENYIPKGCNLVAEPFCGSASFSLSKQMDTILSDLSPELINMLDVVKTGNLDHLVDALKGLAVGSGKEYYYSIRAKDRSRRFQRSDPLYRAARYLYILYFGFNGLHRVNGKGYCNTPYGGPRKLPEGIHQTLLDIREHLNKYCLQLTHTAFNSEIVKQPLVDAVQQGREIFVLIDPPYATGDNGKKVFQEYTPMKVDSVFYNELLEYMRWLDSLGITFLMTNTYCDFVLEYFSEFRIDKVPTKYKVGAKKERVGCQFEAFVTNK